MVSTRLKFTLSKCANLEIKTVIQGFRTHSSITGGFICKLENLI